MDISVAGTIDDALIQSALDHVFTARKRWHDWGHFHTLGTTTYMQEPGEYARFAAHERPWMEDTFAPLYKAVGEALSAHFGLPVVQHPNAAAPGFHVFRKTDVCPVIHLDLPFQRVLWPEPFDSVFTFTLPMMLPAAGAGLDIWNHCDPATANGVDCDQHVQYKHGDLYVHDGLTTHGISTRYELGEDEYRITLQGHGARLGFANALAVFF